LAADWHFLMLQKQRRRMRQQNVASLPTAVIDIYDGCVMCVDTKFSADSKLPPADDDDDGKNQQVELPKSVSTNYF
jgi:hypothetical protein